MSPTVAGAAARVAAIVRAQGPRAPGAAEASRPLDDAERALARRLYPVALEACGNRLMAAGMAAEEAMARVHPTGKIHPAWCPLHDWTPAADCPWCAPTVSDDASMSDGGTR